MFDNNSNIFLFNYEVQLDTIVKAICDISFDIGTQIKEIIELKHKENGFTIEDLFQHRFLLKLSIRPDALSDQTTQDGIVIKGYTNDEFFSIIAAFFNQNLFYTSGFLERLKGSDILLINKKQSYYLSFGDKAKARLIPALKNTKILKQLISNLKSDKIQNSLQKIDMFENDIFYQNTVSSIKQIVQPLLASIHLSFVNKDMIEISEIDKDDFWVNFECYKKIGAELTDCEDYFLVSDKENNKDVGLLINETLLLYANIDLIKYIAEDKIHEYYWLLLQHTYSQKPTIGNSKNDESIEEFKSLNRDVELNQLLSFLKNNLYISDGILIKEKFLKFFNSVVLLDKLDYLDDYEFLMSSNTEEETSLGIYSNVKKGSSYNLLHWLNYKGTSKVSHFRSPIPREKEKILIHTLKPAICYYFLEKYFEDFFESILISNQYDYFANSCFLEKGLSICEVDFFVKTNNRLYYFETKTKLSKIYIDEFLKKSSKMIDKFRPMIEHGIEIKFILLGGYSDNNVKDYQYFIDENGANKELGYNFERLNLKCNPYHFTVPIPDKEGTQIICIAEPEYDKLQNLVLQICQK
jgi:hypothetical protein